MKKSENIDWLRFEKEAYANGFECVCGVDEAGRGPLAGPVCAAAVILPKGMIIDGVHDSKKLSEKKREILFDVIKEKACCCAVAFADVEEIENINILNAAMLAMQRAVDALQIRPGFAIIDGNRLPPIDVSARAVVKGDALSMSVACASILAKVSRDRLMLEYAQKYPQYHFEKHKGYGTKLHIEMLKKYGPCEIHRPSFLTKILSK